VFTDSGGKFTKTGGTVYGNSSMVNKNYRNGFGSINGGRETYGPNDNYPK
jgi:hypothetical protein